MIVYNNSIIKSTKGEFDIVTFEQLKQRLHLEEAKAYFGGNGDYTIRDVVQTNVIPAITNAAETVTETVKTAISFNVSKSSGAFATISAIFAVTSAVICPVIHLFYF